MTEKTRKQENIKGFCRFIDNFNGELIIKFLHSENKDEVAKRNEIWCDGNIVATFKNNEVFINNKKHVS